MIKNFANAVHLYSGNVNLEFVRNVHANIGLTGPAVKLLLQHYQIDANQLHPSGPKQNLLKSDVLSYISQNKLTPKSARITHKTDPQVESAKISSPPQPREKSQKFVDLPLSNMRLTISKRLSLSKRTIPHSYQSVSILANNILALKKKFMAEGYKTSLNDFIIKACSLALRAVPQMNVQWKNDSIVQVPSIDISVAVATPSGLITPILFNCDRLSIEQVSRQLRDLASRAKENKLKPNEFQGGSFTISNLGMFGISDFTAIINPPQAAILAVGGLEQSLDEKLSLENRFSVTLCYDPRAVEELSAQRFLGHLQLLLKEPETMLSGTEGFVDLAALL